MAQQSSFANTLIDTQSLRSSKAFKKRADQLIPLFEKKLSYDEFFAPNFLEAIPTAQLDQIITNISNQYGAPTAIQSIIPNDRNSGIVKLQFAKAIATIEMVVNPNAPNKVSGLLVRGFEVAGDDYQAIESEISTLPGRAGFAIHQLGNQSQFATIRQYRGNDIFAIGSTFKLYILAELAAQIESKQKRWSDIALLSPKSSTLGGTQNWPEGTPLTLQSLATLMISISDNNATDSLIKHLGRANIEARVRQIGHSQADRIIPFLSTAETFSFKMKANDNLRQKFLKASEREQQRLLIKNANKLTIDNYDAREFSNGPLYIDDIEWFATSSDIARVLNILRLSRDPIIKNILAINAGIDPSDAGRWNYLGYKGGSEPGVISMSFILQSKQGVWYSVSGSWNNPNQEVDQNKWAAIMSRILNVLAKR